jgi:superfamily I DNA/RNA helicase
MASMEAGKPPLEITRITGVKEGVKIHIVSQATARSEAEFVGRTIEQLMGGVRFFSMDSEITEGSAPEEYSLSDFAVLCRIRQLMDPIEKALNDHGIPSQRIGNVPFFKEPPAPLLISLLKASTSTEFEFLEGKLQAAGFDSAALERLRKGIAGKNSADALRILAQEIRKPDTSKGNRIVDRLIGLASESGLEPLEFCRLCTLGAEGEGYEPCAERISLMTLHASKGLEFRCVFIIGCEAGLLPYDLAGLKSDSEEERRLLYVGMTRACDHLFLTYAGRRTLFGKRLEPARSDFLDPIEEAIMTTPERGKKERRGDDQLSLL